MLLQQSVKKLPLADVNLQDQTSPVFIGKFNKVTNTTTLTSETAIDDLTIEVASATGISAGSFLILFSPSTVRYYAGTVLDVTDLVVTLDTPLDSALPIGSNVDVTVTNMAVNGSATTQTFGLRGVSAPPGIELTIDVTRVIFTMVTADPVSLSLFGDLPALTNGLVLRKRDGVYNNVFNVKSNRELANLMYDFTPSLATNPAQGENGFVSRLTFGGQSKIGVVQRLKLGEDLEFLIQDNLLAAQSGAQILDFEAIAEGHVVVD